ncbi:MAG: hypothetical protein HKN07_09090 [Acidimicrobiia bacterium]|nr:hypothetical protein [Acidimicrobiia bacterium]
MPTDPSERFSLKDHLFNAERVGYLSDLLSGGIPGFHAKRFVDDVMASMLDLELTQRVEHIAAVLGQYLDSDFTVAAVQIEASLPPPLDLTLTDDDFGDFIIAPFGQYVVDRGLAPEHLDVSLLLIRSITKRFSMERTIRAFLNEYPTETMAKLEEWCTDENYHVRRLVSEGTRPLLPWAPRVGLDVEEPINLLDQLHADPTRYVTRSVANHLNDIAKSRPELVVETLQRWRSLGKQDDAELRWMESHALRTLVKQGHQGALELLGFVASPQIALTPIEFVGTTVAINSSVEFSFDISADTEVRLLVDYEIAFPTATGRTRTKVFKLKQLELAAGETVTVRKRHPLRGNASTFTLHPGTHTIAVQVNGTKYREADFTLTE